MAVDYEDAALAAARRYCGWVVTPPETVTVTLVARGGRLLSLKTLQLTEVTAVTEDGVALDVADLIVVRNTGEIYKKSGACWRGVVEVEMTHGFDEAPDFDAAVEQAAAALSVAATRPDPAMIGKRVDDVEYSWSVTLLQSGGLLNQALLAPYRILPSP